MAAENGVITITDEVPCLVSPARMFRAIFVDNHTLIPQIMPHAVNHVDLHSSDGGVGNVKHVTGVEGASMGDMKLKMDEIDMENLTCKYTVSDCNAYGDMVDFLVSECKFVTNNFHPEGDAKMDEEEIKAGREKAMEIYDFVHAYLANNPDVFANNT
ncbi:hypothetical protein MKW98_016528 [Papaver atlanticum]|uniref:Bet v I/Major latex protein domain-containing protein n=1 Tax=Papaver atlanticum TaxID=357466 RepID=A0AAD4RYU4_9MAGN|nr:hypothetical protein MKW98_016528 [Papaver atlanticum]